MHYEKEQHLLDFVSLSLARMPPKKKLKLLSQGASTPHAENPQLTHPTPVSAQADTPSKLGIEHDPIVADPWTDEQETSLLKGIIKWKPVGSSRSIHLILSFTAF